MIHAVDIRTRLLVSGDTAHIVVPSVFRYNPADPFAVHATFHAAGDTVDWVFSRELLYGGLTNDMGVGDVRVWPSGDEGIPVMYISLCSEEGEALIELPKNEVKAFLEFTYIMVPLDTEKMDIDDLISNLLDGF